MLFLIRKWIPLTILVLIAFRAAADGQAPPTVDQILTSKGVLLTIPSLRTALQDPRPDVRALAAAVLAGRENADSIPLIESALDHSSNELEKQAIAATLITLKDQRGFVAMRELCHEQALREDRRIIAAKLLAGAGDHSCLRDIIEVLNMTDNQSIRLAALQFISKEPALPSPLRENAEYVFERTLQDDFPLNRQLASHCLALFKLTAAESHLATALEQETDSSTRRHMQEDLGALRSDKH